MLITQRGGRRRALASLLTGALVAGLTFVGVSPAGAADTVTVSGGSATWNFTDRWTGYVTGPIAKGSVTPALVDGKSVYQPASGSFDASTGAGTLRFAGTTTYSGHNGALDLTISDLQLRLTSPTTGVLTADFGGTVNPGTGNDAKVADVVVSSTRTGDSLVLAANGVVSADLAAVSDFFGSYVGQPMSTLTATLDAPLPVVTVPATATSTTLAVSPAGTSVEGTALTLSAVVAPAAAGTLEFLDGGTVLGTVPATAGTAVLPVPAPAVGAHAYSARFTPTDPAKFAASTSAVSSHTVTAKPVVPAPVADPRVTVTPTKDVDPSVENTFTITGTGFVGAGAANGAYILLGDASIWKGGGPLVATGWLAQGFVRSTQIVDGVFSTTVTIPAGKLVAGTDYVVATSAAHGLSVTDRTLDTFTPIALKGQEPTPVLEPKVEVFAADGKTPLGNTLVRPGDEIVVKGSGFDPTSNVGGRGAPIPANLPQGSYVVFGSFAEVWQPSTGAGSAVRKIGSQAWALAESVLDQVPPPFQDTVRKEWVNISQDGAFTAKLTLKAPAALEGGRFGVYTFPAGGVKNAVQEIAVPVNFTEKPLPVFEPTVEVFAADGKTPLGNTLVRAGDKVVVKGSGFDPAGNVAPAGNRPPISAGSPAGTYVVFGKFADAWKPSAGAPSSARVVGDQRWALSQAAFDAILPQYQPAVLGQWVTVSPQGEFTAELTVKPKQASGVDVAWPEVGSFGVYAYGAGGTTNPAQELSVPVNYTDAPAPAALTVTPGSSTVKAGDKLTLTVQGLGAGDRVSSVLLGGTTATFVADGPTVTVTVPAGLATGELGITVRSLLGASGTAAVSVLGNPAAMQVGNLHWGVKESFRSYITGNIAKGGVQTSGGARVKGATFGFDQIVGGNWSADSRLGTVSYGGTVAFSGHEGLLNLTVTNPTVDVTSAGSATLVVDVRSANLDGTTFDAKRVRFASLSLPAGTANADGSVSYDGAAATLTADGAKAFSNFYEVGVALDPISFVAGSAGTGTGGGAGDGTTVVQPVDTAKATLSTYQVAPGGQVTISGVGFGANETGLKSVVRSTPRTLATGITANAGGAASATVTIPKNLEPGEHTLSLEGANHTVSATITVTGTAGSGSAAAQCYAQGVNGASLTWGVSDAFRAYIAGPIAKGSTSTTGVKDNGSSFTWSGGKGSFNTDLGKGRTAFGGSVKFTGHAGILDLQVSNPRVQVDGSTGTLIVDVVSSDMNGAKSTSKGVAFATLNLAGKKTTSGATITWTGAPATLTAAGAKAFAGFYEPGTALAPVTFSFPIGGDVECDAFSGLAETGTDAAQATALAVLLLLGGAGLLVASKRRRTQPYLDRSVPTSHRGRYRFSGRPAEP